MGRRTERVSETSVETKVRLRVADTPDEPHAPMLEERMHEPVCTRRADLTRVRRR